MVTSKIKAAIEIQVQKSGKLLTKKLLRSLSPNLLKQCEKSSNWRKALYIILYNAGECKICSKPTTFWSFKRGFATYCGHKCQNSDPDKIHLTQKRNIKKFGGVSPMHSDKVKSKFEATMLDRYGVQYTAQSKMLRRKMSKTLMQNYGVAQTFHSKELLDKAIYTWKVKYGTPYRSMTKDMQRKRSSTMMERYGVEHNLQDREMHEKQQKSAFRIKSMTIQGIKFKYQGYEGHVIKYLVKILNVNPKHIKVGVDVPSIHWFDTKGKRHIYHPDIYAKVKGKWWVIEVKSAYTAGLDTPKSGMFSILKRKAQATIEMGYRFKLIICKSRSISIHVINKVEEKSRKEVKLQVYG